MALFECRAMGRGPGRVSDKYLYMSVSSHLIPTTCLHFAREKEARKILGSEAKVPESVGEL